jgi:hypothetical protein
MRQVSSQLLPLVDKRLETGPLEGLLLGDANRFIRDLYVMLSTKAAFVDFLNAAEKGLPLLEPYVRFVEWVERWQLIHGYENAWRWSGMVDALKRLNAPSLKAFFKETQEGNTPFDRIKTRYYNVETYTSRLIHAMKQSVLEIAPMP